MTTKLRTASFQNDAVTAAKIAANAVGSSELDLTANYAFTGTVSGTPETRVLIKTITASNVAFVEFIHGSSGVVFDNTYSRYEFTIDTAIPATNQTYPDMKLSADGGSSYYGNSAYNLVSWRYYSNGSSTSTQVQYFNDFAGNADQQISSSAASGGVHGFVTVSNVGATARTTFKSQYYAFGANSYYIHTETVGAVESSSVVIDAVKFNFRSGNITSGTFKLFGVK